MRRRIVNLAVVPFVGFFLLVGSRAFAQTWHTEVVYNPDWNITLTDAGYSDWAFDNTPGFEGREYLSGEWGAAISYKVGGRSVSPTWLEPWFSFPDWHTNSSFSVINPIAITGYDAAGVANAAASTIANADLRIDIAYEMVDTLTGLRLGISPASAAGNYINSNRYALKETYTVTNVSSGSESISNLNMFQFLHTLNGVTSVYDSRSYGGAMPNYHYTTTQTAVSTATTPSGNPIDLHDYMGFVSKQAPTAFDSGWYGISGIDDHVTGKPSVGLHFAVEGDSLANNDNFSPTTPSNQWVSGAQKFQLPNLSAGQSASFDLLLSLKTGTIVTPGSSGGGSGSAHGGSGSAGGVDFSIESILESGDFFCEYSVADADEVHSRVAEGEFHLPNFMVPGNLQLYMLEYSGRYDGDIFLTFGYDPTKLAPGTDESLLDVFHFSGNSWHQMHGMVDTLNHTITITTSSLSPFAVGVVPVPEPTTVALVAAGLACLAGRRLLRRRRV
jgi:hypothetical protein